MLPLRSVRRVFQFRRLSRAKSDKLLVVIRKLLWFLFLGSAALAAHGAGIHKWVDEKGQTHYGNAIPETYKQKAKPVDIRGIELTDAQREEGEARAAEEKARAEAVFTRGPKSSDPAARAPAAPVAVASIENRSRCDLAWKRYRESQACFAPYRNANGSIKAEAFKNCTELQEPVGC